MPLEDHVPLAEALHERLLQPGGMVAGPMSGLAFDFATNLRDFEGETAMWGVSYVANHLGHLGWMGLALGFTAIIGPTTPEDRDKFFDYADEFTFSRYLPRSSLSAQERNQRRAHTRHGLRHAAEWLAHHHTSPVDALAYWLALNTGTEPHLNPCYVRLISSLGMLAARRLRPAIAL